MKDVGMIRKIDNLGRVTLPMELRRIMDLNEGDGMEIFVEEDKIIFRKHTTERDLMESYHLISKTLDRQKNSMSATKAEELKILLQRFGELIAE